MKKDTALKIEIVESDKRNADSSIIADLYVQAVRRRLESSSLSNAQQLETVKELIKHFKNEKG